MSEYMLSMVAIFMTVSLCSFASYKPTDKSVRLGLGIVLLAASISPLLSITEELFTFDTPKIPVSDSHYSEYLEAAFESGVAKGIEERFGIGDTEMDVVAEGFSPDSVTAQRIYVYLGIGSARIDPERIENYVNGMNIGKCEVMIRID